ncbi:hypothetical protein EU546_06480 [Candidatus Thorarchaeota archaeon]|nr:MAG: hypothetical protein EU546_06480 [Candidatus Thorarchaeota archaeon]
MYAVNPLQLETEAAKAGIESSELEVPPRVILTFSKIIADELTRIHDLEEWKWPVPRVSPYASPRKLLRGRIESNEIAVVFPPMGASPLAALCEELIHFGCSAIILACASWSLGDDILPRGTIHLPTFATGIDGTSPHYGNTTANVSPKEQTLQIMRETMATEEIESKEGGVGSFEAIYRIRESDIEQFRMQGCLSVENGEVATLYSISHVLDVPIGVLLQPYLDLRDGWTLGYMDEKYRSTCILQANLSVKMVLHM